MWPFRKRLPEESLQLSRGVFREMRRAGEFVGLLEKGVIDGEHHQPGSEVRGNRTRVAKRATRAAGEIDRAKNRTSNGHGQVLTTCSSIPLQTPRVLNAVSMSIAKTPSGVERLPPRRDNLGIHHALSAAGAVPESDDDKPRTRYRPSFPQDRDLRSRRQNCPTRMSMERAEWCTVSCRPPDDPRRKLDAGACHLMDAPGEHA